MKKTIKVFEKNKYVEKEVNYIPFRYIVAMLLTIFEIVSIIAIMIVLAIYVPYFYVAIMLTVVAVVIQIIGSNENPDYKVPWLLFVITLPIVGLMLYFIFHQRKLPKRHFKRLKKLNNSLDYDDSKESESLKKDNELICSQIEQLKKVSGTHLYMNNNLSYFSLGEEMHRSILEELEKANKFIFLEYFIIDEGIFWNSILDILKRKVNEGVEVKIVYDDIGCMNTLPGNYFKQLQKQGIEAVLFSKLKGQADGEFNNRSHRKILVIDGKVGFTGGVNIADEYINKKEVYGHWKDTGIKIEGSAVNELTKMFLSDYYINIKKEIHIDFSSYYSNYEYEENNSYIIPFGDGPNPIYERQVGKTVIMNILNQATKYVYITTPYLIIDNELMRCLENTALRGIDVRIIVPHIPDKKIIFEMTKSNYEILIKSGVKIYEYTPGFIHSKLYISDDVLAMIGTINLDYRSLTHHFENGVVIYKDKIIKDMKNDFLETMNESEYIDKEKGKDNLIKRFIKSIVRIFSPLL